MLIYILLVFFVILLITTYFLFKKDIIHPAVIFNFMFLISVACAIYNIDRWKIELHSNTFFILVFMALEFFIISYIIYKYYQNKIKTKSNSTDKLSTMKSKNIDTKIWKLLIVIAFDIIYIMGIIYFVQNIASKFGVFESYSDALNIFKANTVYKANAKFPRIITLSNKFVISFAYIYLFIAIYNFIYLEENKKKKVVRLLVYLMPAILYAISLLLQSSRGSILRLMLAGLIIFIILWYKKNNFKVIIKLKYILMLFASGCVVLFSFYSVSSLIGRDTLNNSMLEYITMYGGGSIQLFDIYLQNPAKKSEVIGSETFWGTYRFLDDYNIIDLKEKPTGSLEWRKSNNYSIGNVYTAYRRWIQDFGLVGCAIVLALICIFYNVYYNKLKYYNKGNSNLFNIALIFYAYLYYHLVLVSIDCRIFDEIIPASLSQFAVALLVYYFVIKNDWMEVIKKIFKLKGFGKTKCKM